MLLAVLLRRKLEGRLDLRAILRSIAKTAVATAAMAIVAGLVFRYGHDWWAGLETPGHGRHVLMVSTRLAVRLLDVLAPMSLGGAVFLAVAFALRSDELKELLGLRRKRRAEK